jgi:hypothetical protein
MKNRPLLIAAVLIAALIGIDTLRHRGQQAAPALSPTPAGQGGATAPEAQPGQRSPIGPLPGITEPTAGTPTLDLMARLATRRRIDREGSRVYLDSLFANNDSVVVRWPDRGDTPLTVGFVKDSTLPGWSDGILDEMRSAMQAWDGNSASLRFREVPSPDSADIKVHWVAAIQDSGRVGVTTLNWSPEGEVHGADITLALQDGEKHAPLPSALRRRVAAHELGHAIGLPHSGDRDDLMFPSSLVSSPSRRDQATLQLLYAVPPGSIRVPQ